jgi:TonB-dependent receptor
MDRNLFAKKRVSLAVSIALGTVAALPASAQETESAVDQVLEEVVVTGIRSSLKRAMDTKRDATGVVDAITAEDIGDFPDTNLAEALQRITGVSIDRARGEGARVTVRGFGPEFNLVTLNGRQMPTHSGLGRSFDFGDIASEAVSGVEVYKTAQSDVPTGGIGATINVLTAKPLDRPGTEFAINAKGVVDKSTRYGDSVTPEVAVLFSQTFLDDTVGIAVNASFQERHSGQASAATTSWRENLSVLDNGTNINAPREDAITAVPRENTYEINDWDRVRENAQVTLQWRPIETLTATIDYTYAELDLKRQGHNVGAYYTLAAQEGVWTTINGVASPLLYTETATAPDMVMKSYNDGQLNERRSLGFNIAWEPTDRLSLELDVHRSSATTSPNSPYGSSSMVAMSAYNRAVTTTDFTREVPIVTIQMTDPLSPDDLAISGSKFENFWADMDLNQAQLKGSFDFNESLRLDFGLTRTEVENYSAASLVQRDKWSSNESTAYGSVADIVAPASLAGVFSELGGGDEVNLNFFTSDVGSLVDRVVYLNSLNPSNPLYYDKIFGNTPVLNGDCGNAFCALSDPNNGESQFFEDTDAAYIQLSYSGYLFDKPYNIRGGVRYEETEVTSFTILPDYEGIAWVGGNEFIVLQGEKTISDGSQGSYDHTLPSLDFDIELTDDIVLRAAASQTIARAGFGVLTDIPTVPLYVPLAQGDIAEISVNQGDPGILPFEADNYDLSLEYYYDDASYISVGYFEKDVANWIASTETEGVVYDETLVHPGVGPLREAAIEGLGGGGTDTDIRNYILANFADEPGVDAAAGIIYGVVGRDDPLVVTLGESYNSDIIQTIEGVELAWQHNFGDSGFGFIANATFSNASAEADDSSDEPQIQLQGLSDSKNLVLFYDKYGLQARLAYNWRDTFSNVGGGQPSYTREYDQWDGNITYAINDAFTVYVEGINLTNNTFRTYARSTLQVYGVGQQGARYNVGFRYEL